MLNDFDFEVKDRKWIENQGIDQLSRLEGEAMLELEKRLKIMMHFHMKIYCPLLKI